MVGAPFPKSRVKRQTPLRGHLASKAGNSSRVSMSQFAGGNPFFGETRALLSRPLGAMIWLSRRIRLTITAVLRSPFRSSRGGREKVPGFEDADFIDHLSRFWQGGNEKFWERELPFLKNADKVQTSHRWPSEWVMNTFRTGSPRHNPLAPVAGNLWGVGKT